MKIAGQCSIDVMLRRDGVEGGGLPDFVVAGHRHFQKEKPQSLDSPGGFVTGTVFRLPVDIIRLVTSGTSDTATTVDTIEEVLLGYKQK